MPRKTTRPRWKWEAPLTSDSYQLPDERRRELTRCGAAVAIPSIEALIAAALWSKQADPPSWMEVDAALAEMAADATGLQAKLRQADELTIGVIDAGFAVMMHDPAAAGRKLPDLQSELAAFLRVVRQRRQEVRRRRQTKGADPAEIAKRLQAVFISLGVQFDKRPKGAAATALSIILDAIGTPKIDVLNYLKPLVSVSAGKSGT